MSFFFFSRDFSLTKHLAMCCSLITFAFSAFGQDSVKTEDVYVGLGKKLEFNAKNLSEKRTIVVHLPDDYEPNNQTYSTLYLLDGERHLGHSILANKLLREQKFIPPMIIVAIENSKRTGARENDLYHNKLAFRGFIEEIKGYVRKNYSVNGDDILFGHSLAGLFSIELLVNRPGLFDRYIIVGAPLSGVEQKIHKQIQSLTFKDSKSVFISMASRLEENTKDFDAFLYLNAAVQSSAKENLYWSHQVSNSETHITNYYPSYFNGIRQVFQEKAPK